MKALLILLLVSAVGVAGYEYLQHQQQTAAYVEARGQYGPGIQKMKDENQDMMNEQAQLTAKLTALQNQKADLQAQASSSTDSGTATPPPPTPSPSPVPPNPMFAPAAAPKQ